MKNTKNYKLIEISKKEVKRRGLNVYKLAGVNCLIALETMHKEYKYSDNTTWGHLFKGRRSWGVFVKKYVRIPNEKIYFIFEKPELEIIGIKQTTSISGEKTGFTYTCNGHSTFKNYKNAGRVAQSNKAVFGVRIGSVIR